MNIILGMLLIFDIGIVVALYYFFKKIPISDVSMADIKDEQIILKNMHQSIKNELTILKKDSAALFSRTQQAAAEIDHEIQNSKKAILTNIDELVQQFSEKVQEPINKITERHRSIEKLQKVLEQEKNSLALLINRAEKFSSFLSNKMPFEELVKEVEHRKYLDIRRMISQGRSTEQIAHELDLTLSEVQLVKDLAYA